MVTALWWIPEKQSSIMAGGGFSPTVHNSSVSKIWPSLVISHPRLLSDYLVCHPEGQFGETDKGPTVSSRQPASLPAWMEDAVVPSGLGGTGTLQLPRGRFLSRSLIAPLLYTAPRSV